MAVFINIIIVFLIVLCLLLLFIILTPFHYRMAYGYDGKHTFATTVGIGRYVSLFLTSDGKTFHQLHGYLQLGFIRKKINIPLHEQHRSKQKQEKAERRKKRRETEPEKKQTVSKSKQQQSSTMKLKQLISRSLIKDVFVALQDILRLILPHYVKISGRVGFYEPDLTAYLLALTGAAQEHLNKLQINLQPIWEEECFDITIDVAGKIVFIAVIIRCIRLLFSKSSRHTWRRWRALKKLKKLQYQQA